MEHAWGISDPQFLVMYCAGLVLALAWALWSRYRVRKPEAPAPAQQIGVAELAFLAGGPQRVVKAAIARLVETGKIHVGRDGLLTTANTATSDDRVQAAVLREVGRGPSTVWSVVRKVSRDAAVAAIGDQLVEQRLLVAPENSWWRGSAPSSGSMWWGPFGVLWWGPFGVLWLVEGLRLGRPGPGYLFVPWVLTSALVMLLLLWRRAETRTVHGDQVLASVRGVGVGVAEPNPWLHPAVTLGGACEAVALGGLLAFPDANIRNALVPNGAPVTVANAGSGGYSSRGSSSGSSGDGGGSS